MSRRRYLIAYDISEPARLRRVCAVMESYGERLQYSVFLCDLSGIELIAWRTEILAVVDVAGDSIITIDLGPTYSPAPLEVIGTRRKLPRVGPTIV